MESKLDDFKAGLEYVRYLEVVARKVSFASRASSWHPLYDEAVSEARANLQKARKLVEKYGDFRNLMELEEFEQDCRRFGIDLDRENSRRLPYTFLC